MSKKLLREISYYATGGDYRALHQPRSVEELSETMGQISGAGDELLLLGGGTNSLVMDEVWPGSVVLFDRLTGIEVQGDGLLCVGAGVVNSDFVRYCHENGLTGAGWMNGLPGQLGGTTRMNARCYGGEISQIVRRVRTVTRDGQVKLYENNGIFRGYKDTVFMDNGELIAEVEIDLARGDIDKDRALARRCEADRRSKGQFDHPSCGCVFKNNYSVGVPSGMLLEAAGAKDMEYGGARVSSYHANFVFNVNATSRSILELTLQMRELVFRRYGVWMEYEMEILGRLPEDLAERVSEVREENWAEESLDELRRQFRGKEA